MSICLYKDRLIDIYYVKKGGGMMKFNYEVPEMIEINASACANCSCLCGLSSGGGSGSC